MTTSSRKQVSVSFAGDDDVLKHITPLAGKKQSNYKALSKKPGYIELPSSDEEDNNENDTSTEVFRNSEALAEDAGITGDEVFGFRTPKKSKQMSNKASESVKATTSSSRSQTPKSILKKTPRSNQASSSPATPLRQRPARRCQKPVEMTPNRLKARNMQNTSSSDDSLDDEEEQDDSGSEMSIEVTPSTPRSKPDTSAKASVATPKSAKIEMRSKARKDIDNVVQVASVEEYFRAHGGSSVLTSDRTLARLDTPRLDQEALNQALSIVQVDYAAEREALYDEYKVCFKKWMFQLCNGFNLLFHGVGSKRNLIEDFRLSMLKDFNHIVINGYFPSVTIKSILNSITEEVLDDTGSFRSPVEQCDFIRKHYECGDCEDFYLVVHNMDGSMLRPEKTQMLLSLLAQIRGFHIIASIDHLNAPLIWDQTKGSRFNWLWYDVTTYEAYGEETSFENSLLVQQSGVLALSSLTHVMRSLTPNAKGIFLLLAEHQLECAKENSGYQGLSFPDLYQKCREAFLVNSDLTLRTQLTEFKDHKLIRIKKGLDGVDYLLIPLDTATLKEFLDQHDDQP